MKTTSTSNPALCEEKQKRKDKKNKASEMAARERKAGFHAAWSSDGITIVDKDKFSCRQRRALQKSLSPPPRTKAKKTKAHFPT
jgi:hypothetical protein